MFNITIQTNCVNRVNCISLIFTCSAHALYNVIFLFFYLQMRCKSLFLNFLFHMIFSRIDNQDIKLLNQD